MPCEVEFVSKVSSTFEQFSFDHWGVTRLETPLSLALYREWLEAGHHAQMDYLERHLPMKENPQLFQPKARSAIVVAKTYLPHPYPHKESQHLRSALYAKGEDYHFEFRRELEKIADELRAKFPEEEFLCFTDSAPILERDLAARAGLGWVGKNSCLIHPQKGSLFFIGEILTSLDLENPNSLINDFCGTCDRCIKACPTQAIESPRVLNANKCIAYWTIESKEAAPEPLREKFGDWFFGCDICQTVCPWNEKAFGKELMRAQSQPQLPLIPELVQDLKWVLSSSNKSLERTFAAHPYSRTRGSGLKRNALYVIGNLGLEELRKEAQDHEADPRIGEVARWALNQLDKAQGLTAK